ncbi:MAG: DUF502 domain-containing protein, partial [Candidatus Hydrogenedentes bacterium]|nr:DUF502 domain-containing protein [Candidatus Hydrogenedentota bacterium]
CQQGYGSVFPKIKKRLKAYFLTGLVVLLPAVVSIKVFIWLLTYVDDILKPLLEDIFGKYFFGIGIALIVTLVMLVGMFARNYVGKKLVRLVEGIFDRLPFIRTVYSVVRQLIEPFSSEAGNSFRQVVMIEYPMPGRFAIGFIANEHAGRHENGTLITVFLPSNHLHLGYLVVMPVRDVMPLDLTVEEALKLIVSCGIVVPKQIDIRNGKQVRILVEQTAADEPEV